MKYLIYEKLGSVYWIEGDEIAVCPMNNNNTFDTENSGIVETWEECKEDEAIVKELLGFKN